MQTNRREWLKKTGLLLAGLGIAPLEQVSAGIVSSGAAPRDDEQDIRLCFNENPYGPSPAARQAMQDAISDSNRYGWQLTKQLASEVANRHALSPDNILLASGSTEILDQVVQWAARQAGSFVCSDPTFASWMNKAQLLGLKKIGVPLTADKKNDLAALRRAVRADTRMVYLCNPNNPTGTISDREELLDCIRSIPKEVIVLLDEAYLDYTKEISLCDHTATMPNLIIARTFSKIFGLAGARIGYGIAHSDTIKQFSERSVWPGGGISSVSAAAALASLQDQDFLRKSYARNREARAYTESSLEDKGLQVIPSQTNFIYFSLEGYSDDFFERLKQNRIKGTHIFEQQGRWTRITVGTMQEMRYFVDAIR